MNELTKQQKKFLEEYANTLNIKQSALFADYNEKIALKQGRDFLSKKKYLQALNSIIERKIDHLEIPKSYIIKKFIQLIDWASGECAESSTSANVSAKSTKNNKTENCEINKEFTNTHKADLRAFKAPKDPAILLRALEGLTRFLERGKEQGEDAGSDGLSAILGVNCEKI